MLQRLNGTEIVKISTISCFDDKSEDFYKEITMQRIDGRYKMGTIYVAT